MDIALDLQAPHFKILMEKWAFGMSITSILICYSTFKEIEGKCLC